MGFFFGFLASLTLDAQRRDRTRLQTLVGNIPAAAFTNTVGLGRKSAERFIDFLQQF